MVRARENLGGNLKRPGTIRTGGRPPGGETPPRGAPRAAADGSPRRDDRPRGSDSSQREARGRDWRPGGEHRDPRQQFKDAKKARNQRLKTQKFERKLRRDEPRHDRAHGDAPAPERRPDQQGSRPTGPAADRRPQPRDSRSGFDRDSKPQDRRPAAPRGDGTTRPPRNTSYGDANRDRPAFKPRSNGDRDRPAFKPRGDS